MNHKTLIPFIIFLNLALHVKSQWQLTPGPLHCKVDCLIKHNGNMLAGAVTSIYKSTDDGLNWIDVDPPFGNITQFQNMGASIFVHTLGSKLYRSNDEGDTWELRDSQISSDGTVEFGIMGPKIFAASNGDGALVSSDSGHTWTSINNGLTNHYLNTLTISSSYLIAGTNTGIFVSADSGLTWSPSNTGLTNTEIKRLVADGQNIFAGTEEGVFKSTDHGATWLPLNVGAAPIFVRALNTSGNTVAVSTMDNRVFVSNNQGSSWSDVTNPTNRTYVNGFYISGNDLFVCNDGGVFHTGNLGLTWDMRNTGLGYNLVWDLASSGSTVFVLTFETGIYSSNDRGNTWAYNSVNVGEHPDYFSCMAKNGNDFYAAGINGIWKSNDDGNSWLRVDTGLIALVKSMAFMGSIFFAGTFNDSIYVSNNSGYSWTRRGNGLTDNYFPSMATIGNTAIAGSAYDGIFRSTDNGMSWTVSNTGLGVLGVVGLTVDSNKIYACTGPDLFISTDEGLTWTATNFPEDGIRKIIIKDGIIFAQTGFEFFISKNNGLTWIDITAGLPTAQFHGFAVTNTDIFVTADFHGTWRRPLSDVIGIDELENPLHFGFSPNPCSDKLRIWSESKSPLQIRIYDMPGKQVFEESATGKSEIDVSNLKQGFYILEAFDGGSNFYRGKFLKQ